MAPHPRAPQERVHPRHRQGRRFQHGPRAVSQETVQHRALGSGSSNLRGPCHSHEHDRHHVAVRTLGHAAGQGGGMGLGPLLLCVEPSNLR